MQEEFERKLQQKRAQMTKQVQDEVHAQVAALLSTLYQQKYLQSTAIKAEEIGVKRQNAEQWMSRRKLPEHLKERFRRYEHYKWQEHGDVEEETLIHKIPKDLRKDINRHLCLDLLKKVPLFATMDKRLLNAPCDKLNLVHSIEESNILLERDLVDEMPFILRGELACKGNGGFFTYILKAGDFGGEELLTWAAYPNSSNLHISTRTVESISEVEAFSLMPDDLKFVIFQFRPLHTKCFEHTCRNYSLQWRTWATCFIQPAWHRHCKRKIEKSLREAEDRQQEALANEEGSPPSLGATIYASRFAANALRSLQKNGEQDNRIPLTLLPQKPYEPDFATNKR